MPTATATTKPCPRCDDAGMAQHITVMGGVCFACGRTPKGEKASASVIATARERCIGTLQGMIASTAAGRLDPKREPEDRAEVRARIRHAPADVAARATAAFARLGVTL